MRRVLPLLLAVLAACQVDVEGARCQTAEHCPAGQGCGVDERCSTLAATCALGTVGARTRDCGQDGLVCGQKAGAPSCECPPNDGPEFAADPLGSRALDTYPYPTGVASPPACRFGRLGDALTAAAGHASAHPESGAIVRMYGTVPVTFGTVETGETFPLDVAPGVVLRTAAPALEPAAWTIRADPASTSDVVTLHDGAGIEGVTISSVSAAGDVVRLACAAPTAKAKLDRVVLNGGDVAARGLSVTGACDLEAVDLTISDAKGSGLYVDVDLSTPTEPITGATIVGGAITDNGSNGAEVRAGLLALSGSPGHAFTVARNGRFGVVASPEGGDEASATAIEVERTDVFLNGEVGLVIRNLQPGSHATIRSTDVHENRASSATSASVTGRRAGGAIIYGSPAAQLTFAGNRFYSNSHDQLAVISSELWNLSGEDCSGGANVFACHDAGRSGKLIYASGAQQTVDFAQWSPITPDALLVNIAPVAPCPEQSRVPVDCPAIQ